jgi:cytochrome c-type protein NapC
LKRLKQTIQRYWRTISTPSKYYSLGFLSLGGFVMGIIFWGGFNTAMEFTNTEMFCTSCHENLYDELQTTIHFTNRSGVRAICSSCHVPHDWTDKIAWKAGKARPKKSGGACAPAWIQFISATIPLF